MSNSAILYKRLIHGETIADIVPRDRDGRLSIRGLSVPSRSHIDVGSYRSLSLQIDPNLQAVRNAAWTGISFVDCNLEGLSFHQCNVTNCEFRNSKLRDCGFWESLIDCCRFVKCDLTNVAFGGVDWDAPKPNFFREVSLENCNLNGSAHSVEQYQNCKFENCKMRDIDFLGAVFDSCLFVGKLVDVIFRHSSPITPNSARNALRDCDFSQARLVDCQFLNIDMTGMRLPNDSDVIFLPGGPKDLNEWLDLFRGEANKGRRGYIEYLIKDAGTPCIESHAGLRRLFSPEEIQWLIDIAKSGRHEG